MPGQISHLKQSLSATEVFAQARAISGIETHRPVFKFRSSKRYMKFARFLRDKYKR